MTNFQQILIVDDDREIASLLKGLLGSMAPGPVKLCHSISDATEQLKTIRPDLAFVDINLGDGIGYSLLPTLLRNSQARIIIMSATGLSDEDKIAEQHGAHYFLKKPFTLNDIKLAILV